MESMERRWLGFLVVAAATLVAIPGCTTKKLETADTSTTSTTRATERASGGPQTSTSTSTSSSTTSTTSDASPWSLNASQYRGQDGLRVSLDCTPNGETTYSVWGVGTYTDDSSVCLAAVHAGRITVADGGTVRIEISPGLESYGGSEANGVSSTAYGPWDGSFSFVSD